MRSKLVLSLFCVVLVAGACADDDDATTTGDGDTPAADANDTDDDGDGDGDGDDAGGGNGSATMTFQGVTYDLDEVMCDPFEDRRQWMAFDTQDDNASIRIRNGSEQPRYSVEISLNQNAEVWRFNVVGGAESEVAEAARQAIDASDDHIRSDGIGVWPIDAESDEQEALTESLAFDITC
ncbi:MAG: hypothetical protein JJU45_07935 [Acidimicrobiia bacterium]|nr:hypothetical protein [Acidimicrobiia bacterium]